MTRALLIAVGVLLIVGFVWAMRAPVPGIYPERAVPVPEGEWEWLNAE